MAYPQQANSSLNLTEKHSSLSAKIQTRWLLWVALFGLALLPRILYLGRFWGTDERYHWELSNNFFLALTRGDWGNTIPQGLPGVTLAWIDSIALAIKYSWAWLISDSSVSLEAIMAPDRPFALLAERQIPVVLANTLIVVIMFSLVRSLLGNKAAWLGISLVIFDPFLLAESRVMRFEALVAGLMPLALLAALLYLKETRRTPFILAALFTALAMLTKISAVLLFPMIALFGLLTILMNRQNPSVSSWGRLTRYLFWAGLTLFFFWLLWPAMWVTPLETLQEVQNFVELAGEEGFGGRGVFFWGQVFPDDPGYGFYPVALLFRLTPLTHIGLIIAIIMLIRNRNSLWKKATWQTRTTLFLLLYALLFLIIMSLGAKKYDRYLMPIFPALDLVAGVGWLWLGQEWVQRKALFQNYGYKTFAFGWLALTSVQALTTLPHLPYYYTYYNPLLGGPRQAVHYIRVGFAEGLDQVATYLEQKPNAATLKLSSANSSKLDGLFSGETIALDNLDGKWIQGDYVMLYISQRQRGKHSEDIIRYLDRHQPEWILNLKGADYAWLYPGPAAQYYSGGDKLEGRGRFFGYDLCLGEQSCKGNLPERIRAGESLTVTLYWRNEGQRPEDRFFVRLMDIDGYQWAEAIAHPRSGFEEASRQREEIVESEATLQLPIGMPPGEYFLKFGFRTETGKIIGYFEQSGSTHTLKVETPASYPDSIQPPHSLDWSINSDVHISLIGYDLSSPNPSPDTTVWTTLYWQAEEDISHDYVILLRLLDNDQNEAAYWLGRPVRSGYPSTQWQAGQIIQDPWLLTIPPEAKAGSYQLEIALFDAETEAELGRRQLTSLTINR